MESKSKASKNSTTSTASKNPVVSTKRKKIEELNKEVSLYSAVTCATSAKHIDDDTTYTLSANIKVENIAYVKNVVLRFKDSYLNTWKDIPANYLKPLTKDNSYELWDVQAPFTGKDIEFAIKYDVDGKTYWDNNNGKNYVIRKGGSIS